ncbi:YolD-like family protein [Anaerobacillus sp. CMMVII]|nr:YolD-like family protein [Anaerobacillus sp. CMMVII]
MIRDRGNIKWTAMMLPEHVAMLRDLKTSENNKTKPFIDEQRLEEMNETICFAMEEKNKVTVTYYKAYDYIDVVGMIEYFDATSRCIRIATKDERITIYLEAIIDIKVS